MGAKFWQVKSPTRLKKCSEQIVDSCNPAVTDGCCAVVPCTYCLEFAAYGGSQYGVASWTGTGWAGTVGGRAFFAFWQKNHDGVCEFVVELDGVEVYRNDCYGGQSCRDSSDSTGVTIGYDTGTLRWTKQLFRPLEPRQDPETGCTTWFCGDCHCTCKCLCVTITEPDGTILRGEICDVSYSDCDAPQWSGTVGGRSISLTLDRDQYTAECIIGGSIGGEDADWVAVAGCQDLAASFTLGDYTTVAVACKECSCEEEITTLCCGGRNLASTLQLRIYHNDGQCPEVNTTISIGEDGYYTTEVTKQFQISDGGGESCVDALVEVRFFCDAAGPVYLLEYAVTYLGTRSPATGFYSASRLSEDCACPYLGLFEQGLGGVPGELGFVYFEVTELESDCV